MVRHSLALQPLNAHLVDQPPYPWFEGTITVWVQETSKPLLQPVPPPRSGMAALQQNGTHLVDQRRPFAHSRSRTRCKVCMSSSSSLLSWTKRIRRSFAPSRTVAHTQVTSAASCVAASSAADRCDGQRSKLPSPRCIQQWLREGGNTLRTHATTLPTARVKDIPVFDCVWAGIAALLRGP